MRIWIDEVETYAPYVFQEKEGEYKPDYVSSYDIPDDMYARYEAAVKEMQEARDKILQMVKYER